MKQVISTVATVSVPNRKVYDAPRLTVYGPLAHLTQSGSAPASENQGKGFPTKKP